MDPASGREESWVANMPVLPAQPAPIEKPGEDALWTWFGLSYASWLTMPRVLMHAMPDEWQGKMAALLEEYCEAFPNQPDLGTRVQVTHKGRLVATPRWLVNYRHPDRAAIDQLRSKDRV